MELREGVCWLAHDGFDRVAIERNSDVCFHGLDERLFGIFGIFEIFGNFGGVVAMWLFRIVVQV